MNAARKDTRIPYGAFRSALVVTTPAPAVDGDVRETAAKRLRENLASFDAEVAFELANEGERADLWTEIDVGVEDLRTVLATPPVAVKALEWDGGEDDDGSYMAKAHALGFDYAIDDDGIALPPYTSRLNQFVIGRFNTIDAAKAAAQSDFETRIRSVVQ